MRPRVALVLLTLAGCYRPAGEVSCAQTCEPSNMNSDCPGELMCNAAGRCSTGGGACLLDSGVVDPDGTIDPDGTPPIDDPPGQFCIGTAPIRPCFPDGPPTGTTTIQTDIDTDNCALVMDLDGRSTCVIAADMITFGGVNVRKFSGSRPVVLVGVFSIIVPGGRTLDLSSSRLAMLRVGAGAQPQQCQNGTSGTNNQDGGAGGTFAGKGGNGGLGEGGTLGGVAVDPPNMIKFRGGCEGAAGGNGNVSGPGGGAIYLISNNAITISGSIRATGGGGEGGGPSAGGGGGGSGGYIGIDAPLLNITGILSATGGGGGGGGCIGLSGNNGVDADAAGNISAPGGTSTGIDGDGGTGGGGSSNNNASSGADADVNEIGCAGGGGGGGKGTIQFFQGKTCPTQKCFPDAVTNN